ncbi:hypothetical protein QTP70_031068 [Hemibagrus guttatus]|uniref:Uncharacterized protein n=1 Tax=Hemibagrus guttatus TaxID=175788 RepID=A0AAE0PXX5_9TELE|nr:hypothetical protein QTP70_031068 [Hemibagrus guttatus]
MVQGAKKRVFLMNQSDKLLNVQNGIMDRLKRGLEFQQVDSVDMCDVIVTIVPIVSRAGTDIQAALRNIPNSRWSVNREGVFAVDFLCHEDIGLLTCLRNDEALKSITDYLINKPPNTLSSDKAPKYNTDSPGHVGPNTPFSDKAPKHNTDSPGHVGPNTLFSDKAPKYNTDSPGHVGPNTPLLPNNPGWQRLWRIYILPCALSALFVLFIVLFCVFFLRIQGKGQTPTTMMPNITVPTEKPVTTQQLDVTVPTEKPVIIQQPNITITTKHLKLIAARAA